MITARRFRFFIFFQKLNNWHPTVGKRRFFYAKIDVFHTKKWFTSNKSGDIIHS